MPLIELNPGVSDWQDVRLAALILFKASQIPNVADLQDDLRSYYNNPSSTTVEIYTGINRHRKAIVVHNQDEIIIAFQGSGDDELLLNLWTNAKGPNWWDIPYQVHVDGNRVHSFYLYMWNRIKNTVFSALDDAVGRMRDREIVLKKLIIAGYSMGGGVSTLGFTEIVEHIRSTYGSQSSSPQDWASDHNLGNLIQHLTFASTGAGDRGYLTILNQLYMRYRIRAWDFLNHWDQTQFLPPYDFRCWRGHRYILTHDVSGRFSGDFGPLGHAMEGYLHVVEWMADHGSGQVDSAYFSGYAS